jgi:hypothetical protein
MSTERETFEAWVRDVPLHERTPWNVWQARAALAAPSEPAKLAADNFEWSSLDAAVSHMMTKLGADGSIPADDATVDRVMDALHRLDAGQFVPGLTPRASAPAAPAKKENT